MYESSLVKIGWMRLDRHRQKTHRHPEFYIERYNIFFYWNVSTQAWWNLAKFLLVLIFEIIFNVVTFSQDYFRFPGTVLLSFCFQLNSLGCCLPMLLNGIIFCLKSFRSIFKFNRILCAKVTDMLHSKLIYLLRGWDKYCIETIFGPDLTSVKLL